MLEINGLIVNLLRKLEINQTVEAVGLLEHVRLCLTEYVLLQNKQIRLEYQLKIYFLVVVFHVVRDAMEVIQLLLGDNSLHLD